MNMEPYNVSACTRVVLQYDMQRYPRKRKDKSLFNVISLVKIMQLVGFFLSERPVDLGLWYTHTRLRRRAPLPLSTPGRRSLVL